LGNSDACTKRCNNLNNLLDVKQTMPKTVEFISGTIDKKPYAIQIAKDGKWDSCLIIPLVKNKNILSEIQEFLKSNDHKSLSIEVLFTDKNGLTTIFGATHNENLHCDKQDFITGVIKKAIDYKGFDSFILHLNNSLCDGKDVLLAGTPDLVRVGIVNHWFSVGPCQIWEKTKDKKLDTKKITASLDRMPEVTKTKLNFQGISFIFNQNEFSLYHWIKPQCGTMIDGRYTIDKERIFTLCHSVLES
jgi:hypothetical protein